jgi:DNA modification methylase
MTVRILQGDVREVLAGLPSDAFDCVVTSPPYWGLRDYGVDGQIGLEPTLTGYLDTMTDVCREVRRVLKPEGTFWLNLGDSYAGSGRGGNPTGGTKQGTNAGSQSVGVLYGLDGATAKSERERIRAQFEAQRSEGLKPKDLCMVPNRLAIRLQEDGWYVRSEIIWHKPNPMPESVTDRPTSSHEKVWLLTKSERYFYDADAIAERAVTDDEKKWTDGGSDKQRGHSRRHAGFNGRYAEKIAAEGVPEKRNARNVWSISPQPFSGAHFATMPPDLVERCIKAGCAAGGQVLDPFGGAGTTGLVADRLGRHATLIELNSEYIAIAKRRIEGDAPLFCSVA